MTFDLPTIARAMKAAGAPDGTTACGWSVDTRTQNAGDVYFALQGPNHDGHDYIAAAIEKGAAAVVVERASGVRNELVVPDALRALQQLAGWARGVWGGTVAGVTGSAGKTTTKDAIAHLLASELAVGKTVGNFNNHVGVPLSVLRLDPACRVGVLEIGMNHAGEIRELAAIARPDIAVVTNVGYAHVENLGSIEGVALAKRELVESLSRAGTAVLNADDARVAAFASVHAGPVVTFGVDQAADVRAVDIEQSDNGTRFRVDGVQFESSLVGRHAVLNFAAAIAVARVFGIAPAQLRDAVASFTVAKMRGERVERDGMVIWNDCYNSNPDATRAMLDVLQATPARRRIAVLGEMLELGGHSAELHRAVGRYAAARGVDVLVAVRGAAREMANEAMAAGLANRDVHFFEDPAEAGEFARSLARPGDAILFKGSRGVRMERALEKFSG